MIKSLLLSLFLLFHPHHHAAATPVPTPTPTPYIEPISITDTPISESISFFINGDPATAGEFKKAIPKCYTVTMDAIDPENDTVGIFIIMNCITKHGK